MALRAGPAAAAVLALFLLQAPPYVRAKNGMVLVETSDGTGSGWVLGEVLS
jgi:hypothetical protein